MSNYGDRLAPPDLLRMSSSSQQCVTYRCGHCGYLLNLSSSNRNTRDIDSKYSKSVKKGLISFYSIDESRFSQNDELICCPFFLCNNSRGLFRRRTKLLCKKCGSHIGDAYDDPIPPGESNNLDFISGNGTSYRKYEIKINALQPSESDTLLLT